MKIALLDDDKSWLKKAEEILIAYGEAHKIKFDIFQFEDHHQLLSSSEIAFDLIFVDIRLREENGIDVTKTVNEIWKDCPVVYCTDYLYYATDVYETDHMYFVIKDQFEDRLESIFGKLYAQKNKEEETIYFRVIHGGMTRFLLKDILYFERKTRKTLLVTMTSTYQINEKISEVFQHLPKAEFSRCHTSFIINLTNVKEKKGNAFLMKNQALIPVSRSYIKSAREDYLRWCDTQMKWKR